MENIKDLKLIIGPLTNYQWKEVTSWCNENSTDIHFGEKTLMNDCYVKYTYGNTSHQEYVYKEFEFRGYNRLTYQQWYDRFISKDVKQNKEEIMNTKELITVAGSTALRTAFIEELRITKFYTTKENALSFLHIGTCSQKNCLQGWNGEGSLHFTLPQDWQKALETFKEYFKEEPKFKVGDIIYVIDGGAGARGANTLIGEICTREKAIKLKYNGELITENAPLYIKMGEYSWGLCEGYKIRLATSQEILDTLIKESGFKVGDKIVGKNGEARCSTGETYTIFHSEETRDIVEFKLIDATLYVRLYGDHTIYFNASDFQLVPKTKTLLLGDKKIKVEISRGEIWAESKKLSIELVNEVLEDMERNIFLANTTNWDITFKSVKVGCTTLSLDEVKLIKKTYEALND